MALFDSSLLAQIVDVKQLKLWSQISPRDLPDDCFGNQDKIHETSPFPFNNEINKKVALWVGDISHLNAHAIVNSTNEHFNDKSLQSQKILTNAGPRMLQCMKDELVVCKTGDAKISKGFNLPARFVIHTVGPKYNAKYHTAAESALYSCYSKVFHLIRENSIKTLGLCAINTMTRGYPRQAGAHIALRVVRRFLEQHGHLIELIIFAVEDIDIGVYELLMPLYFPRSESEQQYALYYLPQDVGGVNGEPVIPERGIRINAKPLTHDLDGSIDLSSGLDSSLPIGKTTFAKMQGDVDRRHDESNSRVNSLDLLTLEAQRQKHYERLLRKASTMNWDNFVNKRWIYISGLDNCGRTVVVIVGQKFNSLTMCNEQTIMYLISMFDKIVQKDFVVIYFHTLTRNDNHPSIRFVESVYNILDYRYKKNMKGFYIIHPSFWCRLLTWWFTTFTAKSIKNKVFYLGGVEFLKNIMPLQQLQVPSFIMDYDYKVNIFE